MLVACRLAGLSALEAHYAAINGYPQMRPPWQWASPRVVTASKHRVQIASAKRTERVGKAAGLFDQGAAPDAPSALTAGRRARASEIHVTLRDKRAPQTGEG
jgi:hypothetical protein